MASFPFLIVLLLACLPSLLPKFAKRSQQRHKIFSLLFLVGSVAVAIFKYRQSSDIVDLISGALLGLLPFALWKKAEARGNWLALLLIFLISQICLLVGQEAIEFFLFILLSIVFVFNLNAAHLYFHLGSFEAARTSVPRNYFPAFIYSIGLGMILALGFFFLFPRSIQWVNPLGLRQTGESLTGFTGSVALDGSTLTNSSQMVMQIEAPDPTWLLNASLLLYFRGNTVENFDGVQWKRKGAEYFKFQDSRPLSFTRDAESALQKIKVYRESSSNDRIFYPGLLRDFSGPLSLAQHLKYDEGASLFRSNPQPGRFYYDLVISLFKPNLAPLPPKNHRHAEPYTMQAHDVERYLQIPESVKTAPYFMKWVNEVNPQHRKQTFAEATAALTAHFHAHFKTTFERRMPDKDALQYFLTKAHEGYCEYFATASALYLRQMGIPTRLVLGYRGGTFNSVSNVLEVRDSNAHAWIEAYVPDAGWVNFDPTPLTVNAPTENLAYFISLYYSAARFWFERYIVQYNQDTQRQLVQQFTNLGKPENRAVSWKQWTRWLAAVLAVIAMRFGFGQWRRRKGNRGKKRQLPYYYRRFEKHLKKLGIKRNPGETYAAFHTRLKLRGFAPDITDAIDQALEVDLYSANPLNANQRQSIKRQLSQLASR